MEVEKSQWLDERMDAFCECNRNSNAWIAAFQCGTGDCCGKQAIVGKCGRVAAARLWRCMNND
jgi:hypothetical protein